MTVYSDVYSPAQDLSFDEATCAWWKGCLRFCVYNPAKPTKIGIKLYQVCKATSGYCLGFNIYTGSTPCTQYAEALGVGAEATTTTGTVLGLYWQDVDFSTRGNDRCLHWQQTFFWCPDCEVALCVPDCFHVYHFVQNFRTMLLPGAGNGLSSDSDSDWTVVINFCATHI